jgi:putative transposase
MDDFQSLRHTKWECQDHLVWIPRYRKKKLFTALRKDLGAVVKDLARRKECEVVEGHLRPDHGPMLLSIPPKYAVAQAVGFLTGKSAIDIARTWGGRPRHFTGHHFWARGSWVSTVGRDEEAIRQSIRDQEQEDRRFDRELGLFDAAALEEAYPPPIGGSWFSTALSGSHIQASGSAGGT